MFGFDILCCFWFGGLFLFCRTSAFRGKIYEIVSGGCSACFGMVLDGENKTRYPRHVLLLLRPSRSSCVEQRIFFSDSSKHAKSK